MTPAKSSRVLRAIHILIAVCLVGFPAYAKYSGGTGEPNDPYQIATADDLILLGETPEDYDKHFILTADIDLGIYTGTDFRIIGGSDFPFTGVFDGNGKKIYNFSHTSTDRDYVGLFGFVDDPNAQIINLGLINPDIEAGTGDFIGSLVGWLKTGRIVGCYVEDGSVSGDFSVGGLVGLVGGLEGPTGVTIINSYSTGNISGNDYVGGLIGVNTGTVDGCYSTCIVTGTRNVGGLVGQNGAITGYWSIIIISGTISNCYSTGSTSGNEDVGGLVGSYDVGIITNCYATGTVLGNKKVGGLVGTGGIGLGEACFWDIETSGQTNSAGGIGKTTAEMKTAATFLEAGWDFVGETVNGPNDIWKISEGLDYPRLWWEKYGGGTGEPNDPYLIYTAEQLNEMGAEPNDWDKHFKLMADIDLSGHTYDRAVIAPDMNDMHWEFDGTPFTGQFDGDSHVVSNLAIVGDSYLGMFGQISSAAKISDLGLEAVDVNGTGDCVGGLVGVNYGGTATYCYSSGTINGHEYVGGLLGGNSGVVTNCYSTSMVSGNIYVGGLVGVNVVAHHEIPGLGAHYMLGRISRCYSTGAVRGGVYVGGLLGFGSPEREDVTACFWDMQASGRARSAGGTGKTTAEMQTASTFLDAGWDFVNETANGTEDIWWIVEGQDYPRLWWRYGLAFSPHPQDRAGDVAQPLLLSWLPGGSGLYHDIYFGEDEEVVANAIPESTEVYRGRQPAGITTYDPGTLELAKTYYWRIDEVNVLDPNSLWKGNVWSFTTADFLVVDDFESYDDIDPPPGEPGLNRIFDIWIDGYGDPTNGSLVGCNWPIIRFCHEITASGAQSMPYFYDNSGSADYSEATANTVDLVIGQDWSVGDVETLSLWFYGDPNNAPEPIYVGLANVNLPAAVVYHDNPDAVLINEWTEWEIDLQEFAAQGVDLTNVDSVSIGFGDKKDRQPGGSGLVFFDDIRLYRPAEPGR